MGTCALELHTAKTTEEDGRQASPRPEDDDAHGRSPPSRGAVVDACQQQLSRLDRRREEARPAARIDASQADRRWGPLINAGRREEAGQAERDGEAAGQDVPGGGGGGGAGRSRSERRWRSASPSNRPF